MTPPATSTAIVPLPQKGQELYRTSTDAADLCKGIVVASAVAIEGKKYVKVEGWQAIAIAHGCVASSGDVERVTDEDGPGYRAIGKVIRMDTGAVIATAEGFVGDDEKSWGKRAIYARRAMAQTRAISRACRSAFAHVVVMMNAGLETTPAEEVPRDGFDDSPPVSSVAAAKAKVKKAAEVQVEPDSGAVLKVPFGKYQGQSITEIPPEALDWLLKALEMNAVNPEKARWKRQTEQAIEMVKAEIGRRAEAE